MNKQLLVAALFASTLAGCVSSGGGYGGGYPSGYNQPQQIGMGQGLGTLGGAVAGGVIGNQFGRGGGKVAATVAGALLGGFAGNQLGALVDENDRRRAAEAQYQALGTGNTSSWRNPQTGAYGRVQPGPIQGNCRPFTSTIYVDGKAQTGRGTACRNPDGTWTTQG